MKYVLCESPEKASPAQQDLLWLYVCETPIKAGDVVFGAFGLSDGEYMKVVKTGTKRKALTDYEGAVKVVRAASRKELRLKEECARRWKAVQRAEARAMNAEADLYMAQDKDKI